MDSMPEIYEFANQFKKRDNPKSNDITTGIVQSPEPNLKIALDNNIVFESDQIICLENPLLSYFRECQIELEGEIEQDYDDSTLEPNDRKLVNSKGTFKFNGTGNITFTDTLSEGDEVLCQISGENIVVWGKIKKGGG